MEHHETDKAELAIRARLASFSKVRDQHDWRAMATYFAAGADLIGSTGRITRSRDEIERNFKREHETVYKSSSAYREIETIRFLREDVAIVDGVFDVSGARNTDCSTLDSIIGRFTYILALEQGEWQINAYRSMIPANVFGE